MKNRKLNYTLYVIAYAIAILILIVSISVLFSIKAESKSKTAALFDNSQYEVAEDEYSQQLKVILDSYKCYNSGINVTRTVSIDGDRSYNVQIHNRRFSIMDDNDLIQLQKEINLLNIGEDESVQISATLTGITG